LRISYNQGPTLAYWWIDRYVDFDDRQSPKVRLALSDWFRWHRSNELANIGSQLTRVRAEAAAPVSGAQVCRWADDLSVRAMRAYEHAVPAIAEIALTLRPDQLKAIERRYAKNNQDFAEEHLQAKSEDRLREAVKRTVKRAEDYYGPLDESQRALVTARLAASPMDPQVWLAERRARQQDILAALRRWTSEKPSLESVRADLLQLGHRVRHSSREPYRLYQQRLYEYNCGFIAELHNSTDAEQRQHLIRKLGSWQSDIRTLVADIDH
jgi:hypothetical protein